MTKEDSDSGGSSNISKTSTGLRVASAIIPVILLGALVAYLLGPGGNLLNVGIPLPEIAIERVEFLDDKSIVAYIRNTGPEAIEVVQADINDRIMPAAIEPSRNLERFADAKVIIPFDWTAGLPYEVGVTAGDGTRFAKEIVAAAPAPRMTGEQFGLFALIGTYVGVIPVMIGLAWYPFIKNLSRAKYNFFLSLTVGLLLFLGADALIEANEISIESVAGIFNGQLLIVTITIISFLALMFASEKLVSGAKTTKGLVYRASAIALMVSIGIGLHNLGEGLAIGTAAVAGEVALSTFLIIGFAVHNTTEGLAIVSPFAKTQRPKIYYLVALGFIAGFPAVIGTWIGGFVFSPVASIVFLSIGAGAIFQVVYSIAKFITAESGEQRSLFTAPTVAGLAAGLLIMYITSLLI